MMTTTCLVLSFTSEHYKRHTSIDASARPSDARQNILPILLTAECDRDIWHVANTLYLCYEQTRTLGMHCHLKCWSLKVCDVMNAYKLIYLLQHQSIFNVIRCIGKSQQSSSLRFDEQHCELGSLNSKGCPLSSSISAHNHQKIFQMWRLSVLWS